MDWIELAFWADADEIVPDSPRFREDGDVIPEVRRRERAPSPEDFYELQRTDVCSDET
jgi:hypothetical protein